MKIDPDNLTFKHAQDKQPWTNAYAERNERKAEDFRSPFLVNHCVLHITKSLGKIATVLEDTDHSNLGPVPCDANVEIIVKATADIVNSCLKICTIYGTSLAYQLMQRVKEKNGVGYDD